MLDVCLLCTLDLCVETLNSVSLVGTLMFSPVFDLQWTWGFDRNIEEERFRSVMLEHTVSSERKSNTNNIYLIESYTQGLPTHRRLLS